LPERPVIELAAIGLARGVINVLHIGEDGNLLGFAQYAGPVSVDG